MPARKAPSVRRGSLDEHILLSAYVGWTPAYDRVQVRTALDALREKGLVRPTPNGDYAITAAGRSSLGIPPRRARRSLQDVVGIAVRAFVDPDDAYSTCIEVFDHRAWSDDLEGDDLVMARVSMRLNLADFGVRWAAVAKYVSAMGFPCEAWDHLVYGDLLRAGPCLLDD